MDDCSFEWKDVHSWWTDLYWIFALCYLLRYTSTYRSGTFFYVHLLSFIYRVIFRTSSIFVHFCTLLYFFFFCTGTSFWYIFSIKNSFAHLHVHFCRWPVHLLVFDLLFFLFFCVHLYIFLTVHLLYLSFIFILYKSSTCQVQSRSFHSWRSRSWFLYIFSYKGRSERTFGRHLPYIFSYIFSIFMNLLSFI